jgi:ribose 5-phosphate isomerase B
MRVAIGADHAAYELKEHIRDALLAEGHHVIDFGTNSPDRIDYPDIAAPLARSVVSGSHDVGILVCGTGIGMSVAANKIRGCRAALCADSYSARMAREHNDAHVLCLGSRVVGLGLAMEIVHAFLAGHFLGGRYGRRLEKIASLED